MAKTLFLWQADALDARDHHFRASDRDLPKQIDLRPACPPVFDQGERIGSCTANAVCHAFRYNLNRQARLAGQAIPKYHPSRLFLHYNARALAGTQHENRGAQIRDAMKSIAKHGLCREQSWPYRAHRYADPPPAVAYQQALNFQSIEYQRLQQDLLELKHCLAEGFPIVLGMTVYSAFTSAAVQARGVLSLPKKDEEKIGGHAVLAVAYNDKTERFLLMNSWGPTWGQRGYFSVPYEYLLQEKLARDFWTLRAVEEGVRS